MAVIGLKPPTQKDIFKFWFQGEPPQMANPETNLGLMQQVTRIAVIIVVAMIGFLSFFQFLDMPVKKVIP